MSQPVTEHVHGQHGNTVAAWTTVTIIMVAFVVGTIGIIAGNWPVFWVAVALVVAAAIIGKVMQMAGLGKRPAAASH